MAVPFRIDRTQERQILKLEGAIHVRHAQELAAMLGEGLEEGLPVAVETAGLEDVDTCILQLLCSLRKTLPGVSFDSPSPALVGALDRCGLRRELLGAREDL